MTVLATYANSTARLAETCHPVNDPGKMTLQLDNNRVYRCICGGTGETCWEGLYYLDDLTSSRSIPITALREVDVNGSVGNVVGGAGNLASDTTPVFEGSSGTMRVRWATGNTDKVGVSIYLPEDFSGASDVLVRLVVASGGTTNAATFSMTSAWDGGATVTDTATDAAASTSLHTITATIDNTDIPDTAKVLTLIFTPAAHATDTILLYGIELVYERLRVA